MIIWYRRSISLHNSEDAQLESRSLINSLRLHMIHKNVLFGGEFF
jgi:hypothetical protein